MGRKKAGLLYRFLTKFPLIKGYLVRRWGGHRLTEADRELSLAVRRAKKRRKLKEWDKKMLKEELEIAKLQHEMDNINKKSHEEVFIEYFMQLMTGQKPTNTILNQGAQTTLTEDKVKVDMNDAAIDEFLKKIPHTYLPVIKKMKNSQLRNVINQHAPQLNEQTVNKVIEKIKNR